MIVVDSKNYEAWFNKGVALYNLERNDDAIKNYEKALEINRDYQLAKDNLELAKKNTKSWNPFKR